MKFFAVFAAIVAVACGTPSGWTVSQLSEAIQSPHTSAAYLPYLEQALNEMMAAIFAGQQIETVTVAIPSTDLGSMSLNEITQALENPETDPTLVPYLETALNQLMDNLISGSAPVAVAAAASITVPAMDITFWSLSQLSEALQSSSTSPVLVPYLVNALDQIMDTLVAGEQMDFVVISTPAGVIPAEVDATLPIVDVMPVMPTPVEVTPIMPTPVEVAPVNPTPVVVAPVSPAPAAVSSPLVQIIINIKQQEEVASVIPAPVAVAQPAVVPEPINIVEQAPIVPEAISIVEQAPVVPEPISIVEQAPESVIVVDNAPIAPESVSVVQPNPIDIIAVMPPVIVATPSVVGPL